MSSENIANQDESEKCRDLAKNCMENGQYAKAAKFFDKSLRLYPLPGVEELKAKAEKLAAAAAAGNGSSRTESNTSESNSTRQERASPSPMPSSSSRAAAPQPAGSAGSATRAFTVEQESECKRVIALSKKSHYECLGIVKSASENEIKIAYRKLARKFHPDKNGAPSAEGAFKAISSASDTLSDPAKRENYDSYGVDENNAGGGDRARVNPFAGFHRGGNGMHEISPDELFNMFFKQTAGMGGQDFRAHFGRTGGRQQHGQGQGQGQGQGGILQQLMQFLPIVMLVLMSFSSLGGGQQQQVYSLRQNGSYTIPRTTHLQGISPMIPFYVTASFQSAYPVYSSNYKQVELAVENDFKQHLAIQCGSEREIKNRKLYKARYSGKEAREAAEKEGTPSCEEYSKRFTRRS